MALHPLSNQKDPTLPEGAFDVRGWEVRTRRDDHHVGTVRDVLLDAEGWPRYLDVKVDGPGHHVLLPLERAHADPSDEIVVVPGLTSDQFESLPSWAGDPNSLGAAYESRLQQEWDERLRDGRGEPSAARHQTLARLSDLEDHRVSKDSKDVRGWTVVSGDATKIGKVSELLVDRDGMEVEYLDCTLAEDDLGLERVDRHVLLPVEHVRFDTKHDHVVVEHLFAGDLADYPVYTGLPLDDDHRRRVHGFYSDGGAPTGRRSGSGPAGGFFGRPSRPRRERERVAHGAREAESGGRSGEGTVELEGATRDEAVFRQGDQRVRIRVTGDDILIEKEADRG